MYQYDLACERMKELQREMENSRLMAALLGDIVGKLAARTWWLARPLMPRSPLRHPSDVVHSSDEAIGSDAA